MQVLVSRLGACALGLAMASSVNAATTVTGQITSSLTLIASCQVNGSGAATGLNFGSLNFGTTNSLFTNADAQLLGGTGTGGALSVLCSAGTTPTIKVRAGAHDNASAGGTRALADGLGNFVPYDFYTDSGHSALLAIDGVITLATSTGVAQTVNLYGRAVGQEGLRGGRGIVCIGRPLHRGRG